MRRLALMLATVGCWAMFAAVPVHGQVNGAQLSAPEQQATLETFQYAMEYDKTNQAAAWVNPDTGTSGSLVPVRTYQNQEGQYCREYVTTITIGGQAVQGYGTACRQPDGTWMIVSNESSTDSGAQTENQPIEQIYPVYLYPYGYPYWYLDYPFYVWDYYYPGIFFSFNIIDFGGHPHYHHFRHYPFVPWLRGQRWHSFDWARNFGGVRHFERERPLGVGGRSFQGGVREFSGGHYRGGFSGGHYRGGFTGGHYRGGFTGGHYRGGFTGGHYRGGFTGGHYRGGFTGGHYRGGFGGGHYGGGFSRGRH